MKTTYCTTRFISYQQEDLPYYEITNLSHGGGIWMESESDDQDLITYKEKLIGQPVYFNSKLSDIPTSSFIFNTKTVTPQLILENNGHTYFRRPLSENISTTPWSMLEVIDLADFISDTECQSTHATGDSHFYITGKFHHVDCPIKDELTRIRSSDDYAMLFVDEQRTKSLFPLIFIDTNSNIQIFTVDSVHWPFYGFRFYFPNFVPTGTLVTGTLFDKHFRTILLNEVWESAKE